MPAPNLSSILFLPESNRSINRKSPFILKDFAALDTLQEMLSYAKEKLKMVGAGSGRVVYIISAKTVLKLAETDEGVFQNREEFKMVGNAPPEAQLVVPAIKAFDRARGFWMISELVRPLKNWYDFEQAMGGMTKETFEGIILAPEFPSLPPTRLRQMGAPEKLLGWFAGAQALVRAGLSPKDMVGIHQLGKNREGDIVFLDVGGTVEFLETFYDSWFGE